MEPRFVRAFSVGNGNCVLFGVGGQFFLFDMHDKPKTDDDDGTSAWELISPWLPTNADNAKVLDVFCNSHGHTDHCGGFAKFKEQLDAKTLVIGEIWHNGHDRMWKETREELEKAGALDYLALRDEIKRREKSGVGFGNVQVALYSGSNDTACFATAKKPTEFTFDVLHPSKAEIEKKEQLTNDHSLVIRVTFSGTTFLLAGDAESGAWQDFIMKNQQLKAGAKSTVVIMSHHGSYTFFGQNREEVRDADPHPVNYPALDAIEPFNMIISASDRFPCKDNSGDQAPHYAAYKWYKNWFVENRQVSQSIEHPTSWNYTSDGDVYLEFDGSQWSFKTPPNLTKGYLPTGKGPARSGQTYA